MRFVISAIVATNIASGTAFVIPPHGRIDASNNNGALFKLEIAAGGGSSTRNTDVAEKKLQKKSDFQPVDPL